MIRISIHKYILISILALGIVAPFQSASASTTDGLVGYWQLDESAGYAVSDTSSKHNDGIVDGHINWEMGKIKNAFHFDGETLIAILSNTDIPRNDDPYALAAWFKTSDNSGMQGIIGWGDYESMESVNALRFANDEECHNGYGFRNYWWGNDLDGCTDKNILDNKWHHVVAQYDGTKRSMYLDGVEIAHDFPGTNHVSNTNNITIGMTYAGAESFDGSMDDVRVYNRALSKSEIESLAGRERGSVGGFASADYLAKLGIKLEGDSSHEPEIAPQATQITVNQGDGYHFLRTLKFGMQGDDVVVLQKFLGVVPTPSKHFGSLTKAALVNYQKLHGLDADGIAGPKTIAVIEMEINK